MKPTLLFRIASGLLVFFGITHTFGLFAEKKDPAARAVVESMRTVRFETMGFSRTYWEFYVGFGLLATVFLLFSAALSWQLGDIAKNRPRYARGQAWPLAAAQVAVAVLGWTNFFYAPAITATLVAGCLLFAAYLCGRVRG